MLPFRRNIIEVNAKIHSHKFIITSIFYNLALANYLLL